MEPPDSERKPAAPPATPSGSDGDFDPDLDVAPAPRRTSERPDLAAALAQADEELRWAGAAKASEQQTYLKPTTLPRGLVAPTLDMAAIQVREDLDPRKAVTVPVGVLPPPPALPRSAPITVSPISSETPSVVRPASKHIGPKLAVLGALLVVIAGIGRFVVPSGAPGNDLASGLSPGLSSVPFAARSADDGTGDPPSASPSSTGVVAVGTQVAAGTHVLVGSSAPTSPTPKTSAPPIPRPTFDPYADAGTMPRPPLTASTGLSVAPTMSPSSNPAPSTQPSTPLTSIPITTARPVAPFGVRKE